MADVLWALAFTAVGLFAVVVSVNAYGWPFVILLVAVLLAIRDGKS